MCGGTGLARVQDLSSGIPKVIHRISIYNIYILFILRIRQLSRRFLLACRGGTKTSMDQNRTKILDVIFTKIEHLFVEADGSCLATMIQTFAAKNSLKNICNKKTPSNCHIAHLGRRL